MNTFYNDPCILRPLYWDQSVKRCKLNPPPKNFLLLFFSKVSRICGFWLICNLVITACSRISTKHCEANMWLCNHCSQYAVCRRLGKCIGHVGEQFCPCKLYRAVLKRREEKWENMWTQYSPSSCRYGRYIIYSFHSILFYDVQSTGTD